jgi:hypothetical protein
LNFTELQGDKKTRCAKYEDSICEIDRSLLNLSFLDRESCEKNNKSTQTKLHENIDTKQLFAKDKKFTKKDDKLLPFKNKNYNKSKQKTNSKILRDFEKQLLLPVKADSSETDSMRLFSVITSSSSAESISLNFSKKQNKSVFYSKNQPKEKKNKSNKLKSNSLFKKHAYKDMNRSNNNNSRDHRVTFRSRRKSETDNNCFNSLMNIFQCFK